MGAVIPTSWGCYSISEIYLAQSSCSPPGSYCNQLSVISLWAVAVYLHPVLQHIGFQDTAHPGWAGFIKDDVKGAESLPCKYLLKT